MEEYKLWIKKARDDLRWTKHNIEAKEFAGACFSAQQAAETALKAFIVLHNKRLEKIHDVEALLESCVNIDSKFRTLRKPAKILFPYYVETRYPFGDELVSFDKPKANEAYLAASKIVKFVEEKI